MDLRVRIEIVKPTFASLKATQKGCFMKPMERRDRLIREIYLATVDGPAEIRTPDLRRVKTEVFELFVAFSLGEITTRNASAPS